MRILLLIPLATLALAQIPAVQSQGMAGIEGILVNQVNGQPVRKGVISLRVSATGPLPAGAPMPKSYYSVMSNAEGKFVFANKLTQACIL